MTLPLTPFLWSMIQVTLLTVAALVVSWLLRGRRPQATSAFLAGSSLAVCGLTGLVWLPSSHWSVTELTRLSLSPVNASVSSGNMATRSADASITDSNHPSNHHEPGQQPLEPSTSEQTQTSNGSLPGWIATTADWLSFHVQGLDDNLRDFESHAVERSTYLQRLPWLAFGIVAMMCGLWLHSWWWIRSIIRHSLPIADAQAMSLLETLSSRMGVKRLPELLESNRVAIGATVGTRRQRLILNPTWRLWSQEELEAVLLHELAHMLRHDYAWVVLGSWVRMLLFYHPLVHLLVSRWRMEQELAADQLAAGAMQNARAYGRALARLALRAQSGAQMPGPVLTAEQVCIVRRITMLKQGSLKPLKARWRGGAVVVVLTLLVTVPLSSLRGTPPDPSQTVATSDAKSADAPPKAPAGREELAKAHEEYLLTQKAFPPLSYVGRLKWSPHQLLCDEVSPSLRYMQDLVAFALFERLPADLKLQAAAYATLNWENREREHGRISLGATCNQSQGIDSKLILRLLTSTYTGDYKLSTEKKEIAGHEALRLISRIDGSAAHWLVLEGEQVFVGTEQQIIEQLQRPSSGKGQTELVAMADDFQSDFTEAGFALVYDDCDQWSNRLRDFLAGSPKQASLIFIQPYLKDLERIGVFLTGQGGIRLCVRIGYSSEAAAQAGAEAVAMGFDWIKMTTSTTAADRLLADMLQAMQIRTAGKEVTIHFSEAKLIDELCQAIIPEKITGWTDILALVEPSDVPGAVKLACRDNFALTGFWAQSIQAKEYRGKRIRVSAEVGANQDVHSRSGTIIWGSDENLCTLGNATSGKTIGQPVDTESIVKLWNDPDKTIHWQTKVVEWNVPDHCQAISFGAYLACGEIHVRNMKLEVIGSSTSDEVEIELVDLPRNLLQVPGRKLLDSPTNLDFSDKPGRTEAPVLQSAGRGSTTGQPR